MEKGTPHCKLAIIKAMISAGEVRLTLSALAGGAALGIDSLGIVGVVLSLVPADFHKSMTTHADNRVWQDVYQTTTRSGDVYVKITVIDDVLIVSFKEL